MVPEAMNRAAPANKTSGILREFRGCIKTALSKAFIIFERFDEPSQSLGGMLP